MGTTSVPELTLPDPIELVELTMDDGAQIVVRRHGVQGSRVRVFVSHGNGFAVDGYLPFWLPLCARYEVIVFDMRNHGRNTARATPNQDYPHMARDIAQIHDGVADRLGEKKSIGAFHSMAGRAAMRDAVNTGWRWDGLVLFDPPNIPADGHALYEGMVRFEHRLAEWAQARRLRFAAPGELAHDYAGGRAHQSWVAGSHVLMARSVLRRDETVGGWSLVFPGELEAATYLANISMNLWPQASDFAGPVLLVGADPDLERPSPTAIANKTLAHEGGYDYAAIAGAGHMLQLEKPAECLAVMDGFLGKNSLVA